MEIEIADWREMRRDVDQLKVQAGQHAVMLQAVGALQAKVDAVDKKLTTWGGAIAILIPLGNFFAPLVWKMLAGASGVHGVLFSRLILG